MSHRTTTGPLPRPAPSVRERATRAASVVTPLAWALLGGGVVALLAGRRLGWAELTIAGATALVVLLASAAFTIGRTRLRVAVDVRPARVQAGGRAAAGVTSTAAGSRRTLGHGMELTVGEGVAEFHVPSLRPGESHEEVFILPTIRRAIIPVGPATSVRGDPLGLMRRERAWTEVQPLFVHPRSVRLDELGTGFIRDLEGQPTRDVAPADVAFHTMREYEPGDDPRYVHWLTTARTGKLMVRQFVDTRRTHVAVAVDAATGAFADEDEFETAVSAAASIGRRTLADEQDLSAVVGTDRLPSSAPNPFLDALSGVALGPATGCRLGASVDHLLRSVSGLSVAVLISGSQATVPELRSAAVRLPGDVRVVIVRVDHTAHTGFVPLGDHVLATLRALEDLPLLMWTIAS